ncbi:adenylyl cyclase X E-like isoform X2 [Cylas formicarius]|uniref:adenylyl cyclase X E-like isoform X2 n=1 Tax=Cylas formicarius TaxID=197179 RepID=UPI002958ABD3|nr:adenylyl cyclase X E-like isoform X2 [Cylas formicarius]
MTKQFETLELHRLFERYTEKIQFGYFALFLILIFLLFSTHVAVLVFENLHHKDKLLALAPDLALYAMLVIFSVTALILIETVHKRNKKWQYFCVVAFAMIIFTNFFVPIYHHLNKTDNVTRYAPAYTNLLVISCYVFFSIQTNWRATVLGALVSVCHVLVLIFVTYDGRAILIRRVFSDIIFLICLNGMGLFFRYMNEIVQRRSFLDRRDCIVSTFQLKHEQEQEEQLMSSIIPSALINRVKENYLQNKQYFLQNKKMKSQNPFENSLLDEHENVTILFADIVHYTEMTSKLNINDLLETLNELFGRFDDASERLGVIRIKFLGDCYYCVSGLPPNPPPNPAEACVDLGLKMIRIIESVRQERNLNINMRIGIHTGKIISGIIGAVKYQFDIWSKDVDIANKMESEGVAGKVHITKQTKDCLRKPYVIDATDKGGTVPQFKQNKIETFIVSPPPVPTKWTPRESLNSIEEEKSTPPNPRPSLFKKNGTLPTPHLTYSSSHADLNAIPEEANHSLTIIESSNLDQDIARRSTAEVTDRRRDTAYLRRLSQRYRVPEERRITADMKRRTAFMNNNIKRYNERSSAVNREMEEIINNTSFSKKEQYTKIKEISSFLVFYDLKEEVEYIQMRDPLFKYYIFTQVALILCVYLIQNLTLPEWDWWRYEIIASETILVLILLPCTWTYYIYLKFFSDSEIPSNRVLRFFFNSSKFITNNFLSRLTIYTAVFVMFLFCVGLEMFQCEYEYNDDRIMNSHCTIPWHMTETCALALIMTFMFLKIFIWIKLLYALIVTCLYSYCVVSYISSFYKDSETFNPHLKPQVAHIMNVVFLTLILHLIDRQTDYMNRLDHLWTGKLLEEKRKADEQQAVNTNMLINILPRHVAKIYYLDVNREMNDLYHENHSDVAVMFASIIFDDDLQEAAGERAFLIIMNNLITAIDTLINRKEFSKVEKIKIAKWTYMAACGLIPGGKPADIETHPTSATLETLLNFASNMFKKFQEINGVMYNFRLRIGICHGPIVAGVVGSKKPLYDIWGDPVNMASRMDSTGVPGKIQVLQKTAEIIENLGYECEFRDKIAVKGKEGLLPTYFVKMDDNFDLVRRRRPDVID